MAQTACQAGRRDGVTSAGNGASLWDKENVPELDRGGGWTTL